MSVEELKYGPPLQKKKKKINDRVVLRDRLFWNAAQVQLPHLYAIGLLGAFMHQTNSLWAAGMLDTQSFSPCCFILPSPSCLFLSFRVRRCGRSGCK